MKDEGEDDEGRREESRTTNLYLPHSSSLEERERHHRQRVDRKLRSLSVRIENIQQERDLLRAVGREKK